MGGDDRVTVLQALAIHGSTPAWAGTTFYLATWYFKVREHPRVGGDDGQVHYGVKVVVGAPPRGRGRPFVDRVPQHEVGSTPAWAGTTASRCC